jgi:hypothetical protein
LDLSLFQDDGCWFLNLHLLSLHTHT